MQHAARMSMSKPTTCGERGGRTKKGGPCKNKTKTGYLYGRCRLHPENHATTVRRAESLQRIWDAQKAWDVGKKRAVAEDGRDVFENPEQDQEQDLMDEANREASQLNEE